MKETGERLGRASGDRAVIHQPLAALRRTIFLVSGPSQERILIGPVANFKGKFIFFSVFFRRC